MSQMYLNGPSVGRPMSAEEFAAGACCRPDSKPCPPSKPGCDCDPFPVPPTGCGCTSPVPMPPSCGCGCGGSGSDCPADDCCQAGQCCQQMICCCHTVPAPAPQPPQVEEGCCCKQSFRAALSLLCDQQISSLLNFDAAAFITSTYTAGAALTCGRPYAGDVAQTGSGEAGTMGKPIPAPPCCPSNASDNLGTLRGGFRRFSPCSCDLLDIEAQLYTPGGQGCSFSASQVKAGIKGYVSCTDRRVKNLLAAGVAGFCGILLISVAEYTWFYARNMFIYFFLFGLIAACVKLARNSTT